MCCPRISEGRGLLGTREDPDLLVCTFPSKDHLLFYCLTSSGASALTTSSGIKGAVLGDRACLQIKEGVSLVTLRWGFRRGCQLSSIPALAVPNLALTCHCRYPVWPMTCAAFPGWWLLLSGFGVLGECYGHGKLPGFLEHLLLFANLDLLLSPRDKAAVNPSRAKHAMKRIKLRICESTDILSDEYR